MPSDYEAIRKDNVRRRGEDFEDIGNFLAEKLYGDRSHFIFELLQNAEDALSRRREKEPDGDFPGDVTFRLFSDHLEVSHYGQPFDEADVCGICDVLRGTKSERLDQIGTFGIGFKSVYAFTATPEIHSGDEHFVIERFIRPREVRPRALDNADQTLFYFPFNHRSFKPEDAFRLIQTKLGSIGGRSILFLSHVKALIWEVEDTERGFYMRETNPSNFGGSQVQILGEGTNSKDTEDDWLVLQRDVSHPTRNETLSVKVAYSVTRSDDGKAIQPISRSPLTAYFPTARETGLSFLIHGPFASTPARDNIESDCDWNDALLSELSSLVADSLEICKHHGFLDADFLSLLPIDEETFPAGSTFRPIYDAVRMALNDRPLVPCGHEGHAPANTLVLGRSQELRNLLPPSVLNELLGAESLRRDWVDAGVTENRLPKVWQYLRDKCDVPVVNNETFARHITSDFLGAQDDEWMMRFYSFLTGQEALWRAKGTYNYPPEGLLRRKAIIRCEDGHHRPPFDDGGRQIVFLPTDSDSDYPIVGRYIYRDQESAEFVRRLGLVTPDICATVLNEILPQYRGDFEMEDSEHMKHVEVIRDAMRLNESPLYPEMVRTLKTTPWVLGRNAANEEEYFFPPNSLYFPSENLKVFFEGNEDVSFLAESETDIAWNVFGVRSEPVINCRGLRAPSRGFVTIISQFGRHQRGLDGFDPETSIDGLEHALNNITDEKAVYIWNILLPPLIRFLHGRYQHATHQNYDNASTYAMDSEMCGTLKEYPWIPVSGGGYKRPEECTLADLAGELVRNESLARLLGVDQDPAEFENETLRARKMLVTEAGFAPEVADLLVQHREALTPQVINEIIAVYASKQVVGPEFPERPVANRERRVTGVRNRARKADPKTFDKRKRSVRVSAPEVSPKLWLREMYTNAQSVTVCQICCNAMPFRIPSTGEYYFETVQVADNFAKEDHCLYLALCPLCAAKYTVLVKRDENRLTDFIWAIEQANSSDLAVSVDLDEGVYSVRFVESHLLDLKTALVECLS